MQQPPLSEDELAVLRQSIADHGVLNPVIRDKHGNLIDGHNRERIAGELGVDCPGVSVDIEGEDAERLALELQLGRRNLGPDARAKFMAALRRSGMTQKEIANTVGVAQSTVSKALNIPEEYSNGAIEPPPRIANSRGQRRPTTYKRKPTPKPDAVMNERVREINRETQLASMRNAPANKLNLPALRMAREIEAKLRELSTLDAEKFLSQTPSDACRDFDPALAAYWSNWVALCVARADEEGLPERRRVNVNGTLATTTNVLQDQVLEALRVGPMTIDQLANELHYSPRHVGEACRHLDEMGLVGCDQRQKPRLYRATLTEADLRVLNEQPDPS